MPLPHKKPYKFLTFFTLESTKLLHKAYKIRILIVAFILMVLFCAVEARLYQLQMRQHTRLAHKARHIHYRKGTVTPHRGDILDRNGNVLATSTRLTSVYVNPQRIPERKHKALAERFAPILRLPPEKIMRRIKGKRDIPLSRKVSSEKATMVRDVCAELHLKRGAIYFRQDSKRLYPMGSLLAPVIGYTTIDNTGDNRGIAGLEIRYNDWISGRYERFVARRTALRQRLEPIEQDILDATYGNRIILTIDRNIQYGVERALRKGVAKWQADSGVAIVQHTRTGEILAMCSLPSFDPEKFSTYPADFRRNRCITDPIEPGSVMKIFTASILLDLGLVRLNDVIDCLDGRAIVDGRRVTDAGGHRMGRVPFPETFYHSSNVAFSKLGLRIEPDVYFSYLCSFGFGHKTGINLPDESGGILYPLSRWTRLSRTSLPIGYEIGITPIQITCAVSATGNEGKIMRPYIVSEIQDYKGNTLQKFTSRVTSRPISPQTAKKVLDLMEGVVRCGTGKKAQIPGYRLCGKTGTTRKSNKREPEYIASFAGIFPASDPQITCLVSIDNPKGAYYASDVAVPIFREIAQMVLRHLAIPPDVKQTDLQLAKATPSPTPPPPEKIQPKHPVMKGEMPNLLGFTMKAVLKRIGDYQMDIRFVGSGVVIEQTPAPATSLSDVDTCTLVFGRAQ